MYNDEPTTFNDGSESGYSPTDNDEYIGEITVKHSSVPEYWRKLNSDTQGLKLF